MALDISQFPGPGAPVRLGRAEHVQVQERPVQGVLGHVGKIRPVAERAILARFADGLDAVAAELVATAADDARLTEDLQAHGALCL